MQPRFLSLLAILAVVVVVVVVLASSLVEAGTHRPVDSLSPKTDSLAVEGSEDGDKTRDPIRPAKLAAQGERMKREGKCVHLGSKCSKSSECCKKQPSVCLLKKCTSRSEAAHNAINRNQASK